MVFMQFKFFLFQLQLKTLYLRYPCETTILPMQHQHLLELEMSYYDDDIAVIETGISISNQELVLPFLLLNESWCRPYQIDARDKLTQKIENVARSFFFLFFFCVEIRRLFCLIGSRIRGRRSNPRARSSSLIQRRPSWFQGCTSWGWSSILRGCPRSSSLPS